MKTSTPRSGSSRYKRSESSPAKGNTGKKTGREARSENSRSSKSFGSKEEDKGSRFTKDQKPRGSFERKSARDYKKRLDTDSKPIDRERKTSVISSEKPFGRKQRFADTDRPVQRRSRFADNEKLSGRSTENRPFERERKLRRSEGDNYSDRRAESRYGTKERLNPRRDAGKEVHSRGVSKESDSRYVTNRESQAKRRQDKNYREERTLSGKTSGYSGKSTFAGRRKYDQTDGPGARTQHFSGDFESKPTYRDSDRKARYAAREKTGASRYAKAPRKQLDDSIRLNKYIANSGVCSRREADELIKNGAITVNGKIVTEMGVKVKLDDVIMYGDERLRNEKKVYILLNKPKDYITTSDDPQERRIVTDLVRNACKERVFPVGRLDRNTTGLLLLTNDGDIAKKLSHPRHGVRKLYHVHLDKPLTRSDLDQISQGVKLDGETMVKPDNIAYVEDSENKKEIGIEIHSGQNRVVRRIFEHFGYQVTKLDRVMYAGLTKKDLPRGKWRFLTDKEVSFLKMLK